MSLEQRHRSVLYVGSVFCQLLGQSCDDAGLVTAKDTDCDAHAIDVTK